MNTIELIATLKEMGKKGKENIVGGIIDAIINYYNNKANFFEEDAIRVFKRFLKTGVLQFS